MQKDVKPNTSQPRLPIGGIPSILNQNTVMQMLNSRGIPPGMQHQPNKGIANNIYNFLCFYISLFHILIFNFSIGNIFQGNLNRL